MATNSHKAWQFILYEESCLDNWLQVLKDSMYRCSISPLHDRDIKEDGELKKAHWHINILFAKAVTFEFVNEFISSIGGVMAQYIRDRKVMDEYHIHYNDPDKAQYHMKDIILLNGYRYVKGTFEEDDKNMIEVEKIIMNMKIRSYYMLIQYLVSNDYNNYVKSVRRNAYHTNTLIRDMDKILQYTNNS